MQTLSKDDSINLIIELMIFIEDRLKTELAIDTKGNLAGFYFSKGNHHDRRHAGKLIRSQTKVLVGDSHYGGKPLATELADRGVGVVSNTNPDPSPAERKLLKRRSLVESIFSTLKNKYKLVSSYCRSRSGYLLHHLRSLLGYRWGGSWQELGNSRFALYHLFLYIAWPSDLRNKRT